LIMPIALENLPSAKTETAAILVRLGIDPARLEGGDLTAYSPITGEETARLTAHRPE